MNDHIDFYFDIISPYSYIAHKKIKEINQTYLPGKLIAGSTTPGELPLLKGRHLEGKTFIYVCVDNTCKLPVTSTKTAMDLLK